MAERVDEGADHCSVSMTVELMKSDGGDINCRIATLKKPSGIAHILHDKMADAAHSLQVALRQHIGNGASDMPTGMRYNAGDSCVERAGTDKASGSAERGEASPALG